MTIKVHFIFNQLLVTSFKNTEQSSADNYLMTDFAPFGIEPASWNTCTPSFGKVAAYLWPNVIRWDVSRGRTSHRQFFLLEISAPKVWKSEKKKERKISFLSSSGFLLLLFSSFLSFWLLFVPCFLPQEGFWCCEEHFEPREPIFWCRMWQSSSLKRKRRRWFFSPTLGCSTNINNHQWAGFFRGHKNHFWSRWHHC